MSIARGNFLADLQGLSDAGRLEAVAAGALAAAVPPGVMVLRRGVLIAALVALETFVRNRTAECLGLLAYWPARFEDFPAKFRDAAILNALNPIQRYAAMLKRQQGDYEAELVTEITKMSKTFGPAFEFTKFVAGDFTGNISDTSFKELLSNFQVTDCWSTFRQFSSDIGFGVPSVHEVFKEIVSRRHRSAHVTRYSPAASDISDLPTNLFCIGICFDVALAASIQVALNEWRRWSDGHVQWRESVNLYLVEPYGTRLRLTKFGNSRALRIIDSDGVPLEHVPRSVPGRLTVLVTKNEAGLPTSWSLL